MRVPYARTASDDTPLFACDTQKSQGPFECYACRSEVILKRGAVLRPHFAHKSTEACGGGGESVRHNACKYWVCKQLTNPEFKIVSPCGACGEEVVVFRGAPGTQGTVEERHRHKPYQIDTHALRGAQEFFIEVHNTNRCSPQKIEYLNRTNGRLLEIKCLDLYDFPMTFTTEDAVVQRCKACRQRDFEAAQARLARTYFTKWVKRVRLSRKISHPPIMPKRQVFPARYDLPSCAVCKSTKIAFFHAQSNTRYCKTHAPSCKKCKRRWRIDTPLKDECYYCKWRRVCVLCGKNGYQPYMKKTDAGWEHPICTCPICETFGYQPRYASSCVTCREKQKKVRAPDFEEKYQARIALLKARIAARPPPKRAKRTTLDNYFGVKEK